MVSILLTTTDSEDAAKDIAKMAVQKRKAACVSIIRNVVSVYRWNGVIEEQNEFMLLCKTDEKASESLAELIEEMHNYDTPEILKIDISGGSDRYLQWIKESCD